MLVAVLVFLIVFVLYIHIQDQWKRGEDLEVYEMGGPLMALLREFYGADEERSQGPFL